MTLRNSVLAVALALPACHVVAGLDDYEKVPSSALLPAFGDPNNTAITGPTGTCVVNTANEAWCWGAYPGADGVAFSVAPVKVQVEGRVLTLAMGADHRCAQIGELGDDGAKLKTEIWCWGDNARGQLGEGTGDPSQRPVKALLDDTIIFDRFSSGHSHTCAAENDGGRLFCWGANNYGQIGNDAMTDAFEPVELTPPAGGAGGGAATWTGIITAGSFHSCATVDRSEITEAYCWGRNDNGQLGQPKSLAMSATPEYVDDQISIDEGNDHFDRVFGGGSHTCARSGSDSKYLYCWGANDAGQLGDGTTTERHTPKKVNIDTIDSAFMGVRHTCASFQLTAGTYTIKCWGNNDVGQINVEEPEYQPSPTPIQFGEVAAIASQKAEHACAFRADRSFWCWGANDSAQLGIGRTSPFERAPQLVYRPATP